MTPATWRPPVSSSSARVGCRRVPASDGARPGPPTSNSVSLGVAACPSLSIHDLGAAGRGRPYVRDFDGVNDIPTVEGPIVKEIGSFADYPKDVAEWYERMAREWMAAVTSAHAKQRTATNDGFWSGPEAQAVREQRPERARIGLGWLNRSECRLRSRSSNGPGGCNG